MPGRIKQKKAEMPGPGRITNKRYKQKLNSIFGGWNPGIGIY